MQNIIQQLKALGYLIDDKDNNVLATREFGASMIVTKTNHITFSSFYRTNSNALTDHNGFLHYMNELNNSCFVTTYACQEKGTIDFWAKYWGSYDISTFAEFIRVWELDTNYLLDQNEKTEIYLMPDEELDKAMESYCHAENMKAEA